MNRPAYNEGTEPWNIDGSLRDIYVFGTEQSDWEKFVRIACRYPYSYSFDGEARALPSVAEIFENREGGHLLRINLAHATINCHFFVASEIELDVDPKEIRSAAAHSEILSFIEILASVVGKRTLLAPENGPEIPYFSYDPGSETWQVYE